MSTHQTTLTSSTQIVDLSRERTSLAIKWADGHKSNYHYIWLRDNCPMLFDPISGQREFSSKNIPGDIRPESVTLNTHHELEIVWHHDRHVSRFQLDWLRAHCYTNTREEKEWQPALWDARSGADLPVLDYEEVFTKEEVMKEWLTLFRNYGFARLCNVPIKSGMILDIINNLSYEMGREKINGRIHDIKSIPDAPYLAYTNSALLPHTDEAYHDYIPTTQALHCIQNDVKGGESILVDGFKIAAMLRESEPDKFHLLSTLPVLFRWKHEGWDFSNTSPMIRLDTLGSITHIVWSNHSLQPLQLPFDMMEDYYDAYNTFNQMAASDEFQISHPFKPGDFTMMNNHRILHGRKAYSATGVRHLQGCTFPSDGIYSRLRLLNEKLLSHTK